MVEEKNEDDNPKKKSKLPMVIGLVLAIGGGGGGFFAVSSGLLFGDREEATSESHGEIEPLPTLAFVPIDPLIINLGKQSRNKFLRFRAQLEVEGEYEAEVTLLLPRVLDVLNSYLRAVETADLEEPNALIMLRAQMLRRIQLVTGEGRVRDLLVMEFVLN